MATEIPKFAGDLMTREVVTLQPDQTIDHLEEAMRLLKFRHLPVVDGEQLVGLVSQRDVYRSTLSGPATVGALMTRELLKVPPEMPLLEAGKLLLDRKLGCLLVVDGAGKLLGILTEADFTRLALDLLKMRVS
jgi:CBS domain-containing membrane protein